MNLDIGKIVLLIFFAIGLAGPALAAESGIRIVAFGDSLTAGYRLPPEAAFPAQLQKALQERHPDVTIVNAGVSGDTSRAGLQRLEWSLGDNVDAVILELGANDALRGIQPKFTEQALGDIVQKLVDRNIEVLIAGMTAPPNLGNEYAAAFNPIYARLADKHDLPLYPFFLDGVAANPSLNLPDGIHPTGEGIGIIVANILPYVEDLIARVRARSGSN